MKALYILPLLFAFAAAGTSNFTCLCPSDSYLREGERQEWYYSNATSNHGLIVDVCNGLREDEMPIKKEPDSCSCTQKFYVFNCRTCRLKGRLMTYSRPERFSLTPNCWTPADEPTTALPQEPVPEPIETANESPNQIMANATAEAPKITSPVRKKREEMSAAIKAPDTSD